MTSSEPRQIGRYNVERLLGAGGMGAVYLAEDPVLKRRLAIKVVQATSGQQDVLSRFQSEAEISAHLNHPNVITIYDVGQDASVGPFIAMEFVDGASLADLIRDRRLPMAEDRLRTLIQAMEAVHAAHAAGIVHRDIKPGNLMVARDGRVKLMDFGVARSGDSGLTMTGSVMGTPSYVAPEQLTGSEPSQSTDRYAFAVMAFEVFTGTKPYIGATTATLLYNIAHSSPAFPDSMPGDERAVFVRALAKDPSERYADLASFLRALIDATVADPASRGRLLAVLEPTDVREPRTIAPPVTIAEGMKPNMVIVLAVGAVVGFTAVLYVVWTFGRSGPAPSASTTMARERPAASVPPPASQVAAATAPAFGEPPARAPAPSTTSEPRVLNEPTRASTAPTIAPSENPALASLAPADPAFRPRRPTGAELRDAVRGALRDQGLASVEVHVERDGRVRLTNVRDDAEAERARAVAGTISDEPIMVETSVRAPKRHEHRAPRPSIAETLPREDAEPPVQPAPAWEIHRSGAEQTD